MYFTKTIQQRLQGALEYVDSNFPTINNGGCGVFAVMIHDVLASMGIESQFHMVCRSHQCAETIHEETELDKLVYRSWCHVIVSVDNFYIDSSGIYPSFEEFTESDEKWDSMYLSKPMNKEMVGLHVETGGYWNPSFDRGLIPTIETEFNNAVKKVA